MARRVDAFTDRSGSIAGTENVTGFRTGDTVSSRWTFNGIKTWLATFFVAASDKGAVNGVATLDGTGKVPSGQLPASSGGDMLRANNLSDVANAVTARANLGLGTAATKIAVATSAGSGDVGKIPLLDSTGKLDSSTLPSTSAASTTTTEAALSISSSSAAVVTRPAGSALHIVHVTLGAGSGPFTSNVALNTTNSPALGNQILVVVDFAASSNGTLNFQSGGVTKEVFDNPGGALGVRSILFDWDGASAWRSNTPSDSSVSRTIFTFDNTPSAIPTGTSYFKPVGAQGFTILGWSILNPDLVNGSATIDVKVGVPSSGSVSPSSIVASAPVTLSSAQFNSSTSLTGWTPSVPAGAVFGVSVTSTDLKRVVVAFDTT